MQILYITAYPEKHFNNIINCYPFSASIACQKFNTLFIYGIKNNNIKIDVLCPNDILLQMKNEVSISWKIEIENNISYYFCPQYKSSLIKHIHRSKKIKDFLLEYQSKHKDTYIILDYLAPEAYEIAKVANNLCVVVTDLPEHMFTRKFKQIKIKQHYNIARQANTLVLLTDQMKEKFKNPNQKQIVIEGFANSDLIAKNFKKTIKCKTIMYAGSISYSCGIDRLVAAFIRLKDDYDLLLFGNGDYAERLKEVSRTNNRIHYSGIVPNSTIIDIEQKATLLVNPRPLDDDFVKYSFPSKTIEYMTSGTPLLTTKLPGIPQEYYPYMLTFQGDSIDDIYIGLKESLAIDPKTLTTLGENAQSFILKHKTNTQQIQRLLKLMQTESDN